MLGRVLLLLLVPALAGCVLPGQGIPGASHWDWSVEDSMLPDFTGDGPGYPVLLVHQHAAPSRAMEREWRENPVVCLTLDGAPIRSAGLSADMIDCGPPVSDPGSGRLFVARDLFDSWDARAVVVQQDDCAGGAFPLHDGRPGFQVVTPEHAFQVEQRDDGTFLVDGEHVLAPGKTLKATYWVDHGDPDRQRFVRVAIDHPGRWLVSQVGPRGFEPPVRPGQATYTDDGRVLDAHLPRAPEGLDDLLRPLVDATEGHGATVTRLRFALADGALSELDVALRTDRGLTEWYLASRTGEEVRVLGNRSQQGSPGIVPGALLDAFPGALGELAGDGVAHRFVWSRHAAYHDPLPVPLDLAVGDCDDCVLLWDEAGWYRAPLAQASEAPAGDARTLAVTSYAVDGSETVRTYHRS